MCIYVCGYVSVCVYLCVCLCVCVEVPHHLLSHNTLSLEPPVHRLAEQSLRPQRAVCVDSGPRAPREEEAARSRPNGM